MVNIQPCAWFGRKTLQVWRRQSWSDAAKPDPRTMTMKRPQTGLQNLHGSRLWVNTTRFFCDDEFIPAACGSNFSRLSVLSHRPQFPRKIERKPRHGFWSEPADLHSHPRAHQSDWDCFWIRGSLRNAEQQTPGRVDSGVPDNYGAEQRNRIRISI